MPDPVHISETIREIMDNLARVQNATVKRSLERIADALERIVADGLPLYSQNLDYNPVDSDAGNVREWSTAPPGDWSDSGKGDHDGVNSASVALSMCHVCHTGMLYDHETDTWTCPQCGAEKGGE